jgi:TatD DNase family protein
VETDCPYLAPIPYRGKRNEPGFVADTARFLARLRETSADELAAQTSANFERLFAIKTT